MTRRRRTRDESSGGDAPTSVLLICSPGGHMQQMLALKPAWQDCRRAWVSLKAADSERLLADESVVWAHGPTNRSLPMLMRNLFVAARTLRRADPDAVLSTGAALAVPFIIFSRLTGRRAIYVESFTRTDGLSLSGRIVYRFATDFFVQWPEAAVGRPKARYVGAIL